MKKDLPQPAKKTAGEPMITETTGKELFAVWHEVWSLYMEKLPDDLDSKGELRYTKEKEDSTRKMTMKAKFGVDSSTKLTEAQAKDLIASCRTKIAELKKLASPAKEGESEDQTPAPAAAEPEKKPAPAKKKPAAKKKPVAKKK